MKIFVINLKRSPDRRVKIEKQLKSLGLEYEIYEGVDGQLLTDEQIKYYISHYKPFDKAGSYAIQEWIGAVGIQKIVGDYFNVMGLPISRVIIELKKFGITISKQ